MRTTSAHSWASSVKLFPDSRERPTQLFDLVAAEQVHHAVGVGNAKRTNDINMAGRRSSESHVDIVEAVGDYNEFLSTTRKIISLLFLCAWAVR